MNSLKYYFEFVGLQNLFMTCILLADLKAFSNHLGFSTYRVKAFIPSTLDGKELPYIFRVVIFKVCNTRREIDP